MTQGTWRVDPGENRELQIKSGVGRNKLLGNVKKTAGKRKLHIQKRCHILLQ